MNDSYFLVTKKRRFYKANSIDALKINISDPSDVDMLVAFYYDEPYVTMYDNDYYWPQVQIIDINGYPATYTKGNLTVRHIYKDEGSYYFKRRIIDFVKNDTGEQIKGYIFGDLSKSTPYTRIEDFYYSLMALMDLIEKTGDKEYRMHI